MRSRMEMKARPISSHHFFPEYPKARYENGRAVPTTSRCKPIRKISQTLHKKYLPDLARKIFQQTLREIFLSDLVQNIFIASMTMPGNLIRSRHGTWQFSRVMPSSQVGIE
jgi:hypothetical protein